MLAFELDMLALVFHFGMWVILAGGNQDPVDTGEISTPPLTI